MTNRVMAVVHDFDHLVRFHQLGFVCVWPLLGWACVRDWSAVPILWLLVVVFFWHSFSAVINDIVDVNVDRADPVRAGSWLVRGTLTGPQALAVAFAQLPFMLGAHVAAGFPRDALVWLFLGAVAENVYNVYGKRCPIPVFTELAQGAAAFLITVYGAAAADQPANRLVWLTAASAAAFVLLVNGFHGSLRDIVNDRCKRTASIWLGCHIADTGTLHISRPMTLYASIWQALMVVLSLSLAVQLSQAGRRFAVITVAVAAVANVGVFLALHYLKKPAWDVVLRIHVAIAMVPVMLAFIPRLGMLNSTALFAFYAAPVALVTDWWYRHGFTRALTSR